VNQLSYNTGAFRAPRTRDPNTKEQRIFGVVFAFTVEAAIIYILLSSLGVVPKAFIPPPLTIVDIKTPEVDPTVPPPPPPTFQAPTITPEVVPAIMLDYVPPQEHAITPPADPPKQVATLVPPTPAFTAARALIATHTTPDYPPVSRRLGEQGSLRLRLAITADGAVKDAMVEQSSGYPRLDDAAVQWVKAHWRYAPATEGTRPVASMLSAIVTFKLQ
jgi:periplasmic protein TonB